MKFENACIKTCHHKYTKITNISKYDFMICKYCTYKFDTIYFTIQDSTNHKQWQSSFIIWNDYRIANLCGK